ncbi:SPOR domain-containing protein [Psychroflexus sp. YR1-1]|uniref:SPOR domain-containing protein n=1 Tax=Psychroflexus aurantiacus TaxID=2709310 RepID=A0A6B3QXW7_9FLAO|nr:SPOR domain-containing protein [Psychroflexus aurantiacus]NEV92929.1 SPOR domain-containing protein [Psychroflexus aurantiacus]
MRVEDYIKDLLYRYECVIVPGFGAFVTQKNTSAYHADSHRFTPPSRKLTFNKAIQNHDGLLAETIAKGESMDFDSAKHKIQLFVKDFQTALRLEKVIDIPQLGRFKLDEEHKLSFEPNDATNYFVESFGLAEMTLDSVSQALQENAAEEDSGVKVRTLQAPVMAEETSEVKHRRPYLKYAAVGVIALSLIGFGGLYQYNTYVISHNDAEAQKAESLLQDKIQSAEFSYTLSELPLSTTKLETLKPKYHIIAGAFRVKSNAIRKVELLRAQGYKASMIGENAYGLHQVAFDSYVQKEEALSQLRTIKATENPEAWLYVKQL